MELQTFLAAIKKRPFVLRSCSICGRELAFRFEGDQLGYDDACDCTTTGGWSPRSADDLAFYLNPDHGWFAKIEGFVKETNELPGS